jgi:rhamnogalacturonyl hydrolase YesR
MLTRRSFLKVASITAVASITPAQAGNSDDTPQLLVVSGNGPDHPVMRSAISQLLEQGIWFQTDDEQQLPSKLPERLDGYRAILLDEPAAEAVITDEVQRRRLQEFAAGGGFVFRMETPPVPTAAPSESSSKPGSRAVAAKDTSAAHANHWIDLVTSHRCHEMITHAGLKRFHPGARRQWLDFREDRMLAELKARLVPRISRAHSLNEFALHHWKAACALIDAGHDDVRPALIRGIELSAADIAEPIDHDRVSGYFGLIWLAEQTGQRKWLEQAQALVDDVIRRRPRHMGVMAGGGFVDDPLGLGNAASESTALHRSGSTNRRDVVWTEFLHFHGPTLASLARVTGDRRYLDEAMKTVEHVQRYHLRPDGLLAHCTRYGRPVAGAWTRGQTHALYGLLYMLEELKPDQPEFRTVLKLVEQVGEGLMGVQDSRTGLWRNLIDHPASRLESSGTTGIAYVYGRCVREGWLDRDRFEPMVLKGWDGVRTLYWRGGVAANCRGTGTGDEAYYLARPQGWAPVPQLTMALLEAQRLRQSDA